MSFKEMEKLLYNKRIRPEWWIKAQVSVEVRDKATDLLHEPVGVQVIERISSHIFYRYLRRTE